MRRDTLLHTNKQGAAPRTLPDATPDAANPAGRHRRRHTTARVAPHAHAAPRHVVGSRLDVVMYQSRAERASGVRYRQVQRHAVCGEHSSHVIPLQSGLIAA